MQAEPRQIDTGTGAGNAKAAAGASQQAPGIISGTTIDQGGAMAVGAKVELTGDDRGAGVQVFSDSDGHFAFTNVAPGPFKLTVTAPGFATQLISGTLRPGETYVAPPIVLPVATVSTKVDVSLTQVEVAELQIKQEEKQRVLGFIPNFYVSYIPDAAPLTPKQKFKLAWKSLTDPFTFLGVGAYAGLEQASDEFGGYGQGAEGYGKRYGAAYADTITGTFIGSAIMPSLLKQDPRYFYKGTGSTRSRILYAISNAVICKDDNKRWQPNYSSFVGILASGGLSYLYYPASDRNGAGLFFQSAALRLGGSAGAGIFQEFLVRKLTPHTHSRNEP